MAVAAMLASTGPAQAAAVERFSTRTDTFQRLQDVLDVLFPEDRMVPGLSGTLGLGLGYSPAYLGSDNYNLTAVPLVRLNYRNIVTLSGTALRYNVLRNERWTLGLHGRYLSGRGSRQAGVLAGFEDIDPTLAFGPYVEYRMGRTQLAAEWRHALGAGQGDELRLTLSSGLYASRDRKFGLHGAASATVGSAKYMRTNFGVSPEDARQSTAGLAPYRPGGGFYSLSLSLGGQYMLSDNWGFGQFIELERLAGPAEDSPLVKAGSAWQFTSGLGLYYKF